MRVPADRIREHVGGMRDAAGFEPKRAPPIPMAAPLSSSFINAERPYTCLAHTRGTPCTRSAKTAPLSRVCKTHPSPAPLVSLGRQLRPRLGVGPRPYTYVL
jgi:hypothetical protein